MTVLNFPIIPRPRPGEFGHSAVLFDDPAQEELQFVSANTFTGIADALNGLALLCEQGNVTSEALTAGIRLVEYEARCAAKVLRSHK